MPERQVLKSKICLVGDKAVGKTSLIRRYVLDQFDDAYIRTLGAKVTKKAMDIDLPDGAARVDLRMSIWDVIGHAGFRRLLKEAFFEGVQGVLAVVDLTRRDTLPAIAAWVEGVESVAGPVPAVLVGNKSDLKSAAQFGRPEVAQMAAVLRCGYLLTSAKSGENVEEAFLRLGTLVATSSLGLDRSRGRDGPSAGRLGRPAASATDGRHPEALTAGYITHGGISPRGEREFGGGGSRPRFCPSSARPAGTL